MAKNTYKSNTFKKESKERSFPKFSFSFFNDRRFQLTLGFFLLGMSLFLLTSFISYLFTGKADQSVIDAVSTIGLKDSGLEAENWLGLFGAFSAHYFIFNWFGIAAFLIPPLCFLAGYFVAYRKEVYALDRAAFFVLFFLLWVSISMGFILLSSDELTEWGFLSGGVGYELAILGDSLMGWGTTIFLGFLLLVFLIYYFNITDVLLPAFGVSRGQTSIAPEEELVETIEEGSDEEEDETEEEGTETDGDEGEDEFTLIVREPKKKEETIQEDELEIEQKVEEKEEEPDELAAVLAAVKEEVELEEQKEEPKETNSEAWTVDKEKKPTRTPKEEPDLELAIEDPTEEKESVLPAFTVDPVSEEAKKVQEQEDYDPTLDLPSYQFPTPELLNEYPEKKVQVSKEELEANKDKIVETLINFKIGISSIKATIGPTVTLYEIVPEAGVKISKIKNLEDDIALNLAALGIRIIAPIPGKGTIGIEVPNKNREMVDARTVITHEKFSKSKMELPVVLGKTISNEVYVTDLAKMPHLLMAGATGQGKSVGLNIMLTSLLYCKHPSQLKFVLVDPKKVELTLFNKIERHFLAKLPNSEEAIITDTKKVIYTLNSLCMEMDNRYDLLKDAGCRNLKEYNKKFVERRLNPQKGHRFLPYIVLVIDELADLMMTAGKEIETPIARLAQLARAIGIHLVVATQRPSVNVITGIIKANFPARLSFRVTSKIDSRTILDAGGAEQLVGMGDMLLSQGSDLTRLQCAFVDTPEVDRICEWIGDQRGYEDAYLLPEYEGEEESMPGDVDLADRDALFDDAARLLVIHQQGSTSLIQRKLKLGYNRAGRLIDQLEAAGIVGPFEGSKAREVLVKDEYALEQRLNEING
ncbi:MAG: DNA translocase FtsK 4TM domain-containing protein [Cyclobacteriaceae bacterium]